MTVFNETGMPELTAKHLSYKDIQREASQLYNNHITIRTIKRRIKNKWDLDKIEQTSPRARTSYMYKGKWRTTKELVQIAKENYDNPINARTLRKRIQNGETIHQAILARSNAKLISMQDTYIYQGKKYYRNKLVEIAKKQYKQRGYLNSELARDIFAINLVDYTRHNKTSYRALAKNLCIAVTTLRSYVNLTRTPSLVVAVEIANQLHVTLNDLVKVPDK